MEYYARASKTPLERIDNNEGPARASKSPLEREGRNLGNYSWFLSPTNLYQTRPTQPKTRTLGVEDVNNTHTTTNSTVPKSGYNNLKKRETGIAITISIQFPFLFNFQIDL